jgi:hypothetical protein
MFSESLLVPQGEPRPNLRNLEFIQCGWGGMGCGNGNTTVRQDKPLGNIFDEAVHVLTLIVALLRVMSMRTSCGYFVAM